MSEHVTQHLRGTLVYVMGASGSGKDSLMTFARQQLAHHPCICFAHRYITRPADAGGENHVALTVPEFESRVRARLFGLHWQSHGLRYGIGIEVNQWLAKGMTVVVNGSREYLPQAQQAYPELLPVSIDVSTRVLHERLLARGREDAAGIEKRLQRHAELRRQQLPGRVLNNDGPLEVGGRLLVDLLLAQSEALA